MGDRPMLCIRCFGEFEALLDGQPLAGLHKRHGKKLLACLLLRHDRKIPSSELAETFWSGVEADEWDFDEEEAGSSPQRRAQNSLNRSKTELKRALKEEGGRLEYGYGTVLFRLEGVEVDLFE